MTLPSLLLLPPDQSPVTTLLTQQQPNSKLPQLPGGNRGKIAKVNPPFKKRQWNDPLYTTHIAILYTGSSYTFHVTIHFITTENSDIAKKTEIALGFFMDQESCSTLVNRTSR